MKLSAIKASAQTFLRGNFPPYRDYRFWLIQVLNLITCLEITSLPSHNDSKGALTIQLENSFVLKTFVFFFLLSTLSSAFIFGWRGAMFTILLTSVFLIPKIYSWWQVSYDHLLAARFVVISILALVIAILVSRERTTRQNVQGLNTKMNEIIHEKDRYFKLASEAQENERRRISRDLHDDSLQLLATVMRQLDGALHAENSEDIRKQMVRAKETITTTSEAIRRYCEELRPMLLDSMGLIPAVEWIGQELEIHTGVKVVFQTKGEAIAISNRDLIHIFRVMQEAFHNIEKHSKATAVKALWDFSGDSFEITLTDNGIGMWNFGQSTSRSLGIQGMYERTELVGGKLTIESQPGFGTKVSLQVPFEKQ